MKFNGETIEISKDEFIEVASTSATAFIISLDRFDDDELRGRISIFLDGLATCLFTEKIAKDFMEIARKASTCDYSEELK